MAVDRRTKSVNGRTVSLPENSDSGAGAAVSRSMAEVMGQTRTGALTAGEELNNLSLTRVEAVTLLARLLNWPMASEGSLPFEDVEDIPVASCPAVAEARARGIVKGYPGGSFRPMAALSRAEAAVILAAVLQDLGLESEISSAPPYSDAGDIPSWAVEAISRVTSAGLFDRQADEIFARQSRLR